MTSAGNRKPAKAEPDGECRQEWQDNFTRPILPAPADDRSTQQCRRQSRKVVQAEPTPLMQEWLDNPEPPSPPLRRLLVDWLRTATGDADNPDAPVIMHEVGLTVYTRWWPKSIRWRHRAKMKSATCDRHKFGTAHQRVNQSRGSPLTPWQRLGSRVNSSDRRNGDGVHRAERN
jgi:hypothetical protein